MNVPRVLLTDFYSQKFLDHVAQYVRGGKRAAALRQRLVERSASLRGLLLEEKDTWCCGICVASLKCCFACGQETSAAVRAAPRPIMLMPEDVSDMYALETAAALATATRAMRGAPAMLSSSYPHTDMHVRVWT